MKILIGCEHSQVVTEQFIKRGHEVKSCDLYTADKGYDHYQGDVMDIINDGYDMAIFFPPCTYLAKAQMWRCEKSFLRYLKREQAYRFALSLYQSDIPKVIMENPAGYLNTHWRQPDQILSPHQFGDNYSKDIC